MHTPTNTRTTQKHNPSSTVIIMTDAQKHQSHKHRSKQQSHTLAKLQIYTLPSTLHLH